MSEGRERRTSLFRTGCMMLLLLAGIAAALVTVRIGYGFSTGQFGFPSPTDPYLICALLTMLLTPITFLLMFWLSPYRQTLWDFLFIMGSLCIFLFSYSTISFFIFTIPTLVGGSTTLSQLVWRGLFWALMFLLPAITLPLPVARAAHKEKHLLPSGGSVFEDPTPLAFLAAGLAGLYVFTKTFEVPLFLSFLIGFPALLLFILCFLTLIIYAYESGRTLFWLSLFVFTSGLIILFTGGVGF